MKAHFLSFFFHSPDSTGRLDRQSGTGWGGARAGLGEGSAVDVGVERLCRARLRLDSTAGEIPGRRHTTDGGRELFSGSFAKKYQEGQWSPVSRLQRRGRGGGICGWVTDPGAGLDADLPAFPGMGEWGRRTGNHFFLLGCVIVWNLPSPFGFTGLVSARSRLTHSVVWGRCRREVRDLHTTAKTEIKTLDRHVLAENTTNKYPDAVWYDPTQPNTP
ncbi:hypothetical protein QBC39DRAFT_74297 [Podospora conica]|nr:hypothetical protein QBC39DRAFT_74297 [Schizothecium conicum]